MSKISFQSQTRDEGWQNLVQGKSVEFICGYCNNKVASSVGFFNATRLQSSQYGTYGIIDEQVYICPNCQRPTYFFDDQQVPGEPYPHSVKGLEDKVEIATIFEEMITCYKNNANTSVILLGRKLIMHIACEEGAPENQSFAQYVRFLDDENIIPRNAKSWVDKIRVFGNETTHELKVNTKDDAKTILDFVIMLLKLTFEFVDSTGETTS